MPYSEDMPKVGQGPATKATEEDLQKDASGFTTPNLHTRIISDSTEDNVPTDYSVGIYGVNSYRTTQRKYHDENSTDSDIP